MEHNTSFDYDVLRDCYILEQNLTFENLYKISSNHNEIKGAVWLEDETEHFLTYKQLAAKTDAYAARLKEFFGTEGRVCISVDTCKEWFPLFWGLIRSGHDIVDIDASLPPEKLTHLMDQAGCNKLVTVHRRNIGSEYKQILLDELESAPEVDNYSPVWGHNIALCTSGTTSESRIFVYNEESVCRIALFSKKAYKENPFPVVSKNYRTLAFLPFHHILGFSSTFIWCHFLGYTIVYLKDRTPKTVTRTCQLCKVNQVITVPLLANNLRRSLKSELKKKGYLKMLSFNLMIGAGLLVQWISPLKGLAVTKKMFRGVQRQLLGTEIENIVLGGSHTDRKSLRLLNGIGYFTHCGYGMTETSISSLELSMKLFDRLRGRIGSNLNGLEFKIDGNQQIGELLIKGKCIHNGRLIDGSMVGPDLDSNGWFHTGDIVRSYNEGEDYSIAGRLKEVIINESGENVYPDEMEELFSAVEGLRNYCVLGLKRNDKDALYEEISMVINVADKFDDENYLKKLSNSIYAVNRTIPVFKRVFRALVTPEDLPTANKFKVKRLELKKSIESGSLQVKEIDINTRRNLAAAAVGRNDDTAAKTRAIFSEVLNIPAKSLKDNSDIIADLGGDSLQVLSIATKAEEVFGVLIPDENVGRCTSINGTAELIRELLSGTTKTEIRTERTAVTDFENSQEYMEFKERRDALEKGGGGVPYFVCHNSAMRDTSVIDGKEVIDFGSYNYVGMSGRKEVSNAAKKAIDLYGTSASGSRLLAGERPVHGELEKEIAEWKHAESAVVCVGGHSTNVTVVGNFCGKNDLILYDALAHNSIDQGCKLSEATTKSFPHNDISALERILKIQRKYFEKVLIIIEGAYSMDGDISDVPAFVAIKKKYGCFLMVDEAHSACVLGKTGGGVDEYFNLESGDVDIKMGTLSKGLGTCGGYIAGRKCLIDYLRFNLPGFVFSVGISPALAAASLEAIRLLRHNPEIMERLHRNIEYFANEAKKRHLDIGNAGKTAILPVLIGREEDAFAMSNEMLRRGVSVPPAVFPAVPHNKAKLRFNVISEHSPEQIEKALDILVETAKDLGINLPHCL